MNNRHKRIIAVIGLLLFGGVIGAAITLYYFSIQSTNLTVLDQSNAMMNNTALLKNIRSGQTTRAVDMLEANLEGNLIFFSFDHKADKLIEHRALEALKQAKEYRKEYPRSTNDKELGAHLDKALSRTKINER